MTEQLLSILGQRIRERRHRLGLSQEELAHVAGLDRSYVGRIERGEDNLTFASLVKLCLAMQCDIAALTAGLPPAPPARYP